MALRIDSDLRRDLARFGGETATKCFNCGNCTAICSHAEEGHAFPRKYIRFIQIGAGEKIRASVDPWLCYYCGECSDTCPRQAEPGELMMAARRWLTSAYDWTGLSRLMYRHHWAEVGTLAAVGLVVLLLFTVPEGFGFKLLAAHPEAKASVNLHWFAPKEIVHWGDLVLAVLLSGFLLSNAARMVWFVMRDRRVPPAAWATNFKELVVHGATQVKWRECLGGATKNWLRHLVLVTGYATMFLLVVVFLPWFQVEGTGFHWTSLLGYYSTVVLLGTTIWMFRDRMEKKDQIHKYSHLSDWLFLVLLFLTSVTGIFLHLFRLVNLAMPTYWMYTVHLMVAVSMLVIEVPFGKWSHLLYRPLAAYLQAVLKRAGAEEAKPQPAVAAAA
jgi:ferredoxin